MLKRAGKVTAITTQSGEQYLPSEMNLMIPETQEEIALGMFCLYDSEDEILVFHPQAIRMKKNPIPENIPEEPEYPEVDG